jgi:nucleoside 2-deoxyribosyltransferase
MGAVSGWVRQQNAMGLTPSINSEKVKDLRMLTKPSFQERAEKFLIAAAQKAPKLDQWFNPGAPDFIGKSYSDDQGELVIILKYLKDEGLLTDTAMQQGERLTAKGYIAADELRARRAASTQAFVAMWLDDKMTAVYENGIEPGVRNAGFKAMLIPRKEHANKIDDEIIAEIRRSAFIVADFTGHRQNVYFECGYALALGRQPIWTCRKDDIPNLHFDIRQYNSIDWENEAELAQRLTNRIVAMFGQGPIVHA